MDQHIKNFVGWAIILALVVGTFSFSHFVSSYSKSIDPSSIRSFSVSAQGEAVSIPDVAKFTFSIINQGGKNIAGLQKDNTAKANAVIDYLKSNGVEKEDIKTLSYNVTPRYQYYSCPRDGGPCPPAEIVGYTVNQTVSVKIRDFDKAGDLLAGAVEKGANSVSQLSFEIDDPTEVQNQAREEAIKKAKEKAKDIAKAGGFGLGKLLSIQESGQTPIPYFARSEFDAIGIGGGGATPQIEPGSQETTVNVTLTYEIR